MPFSLAKPDTVPEFTDPGSIGWVSVARLMAFGGLSPYDKLAVFFNRAAHFTKFCGANRPFIPPLAKLLSTNGLFEISP